MRYPRRGRGPSTHHLLIQRHCVAICVGFPLIDRTNWKRTSVAPGIWECSGWTGYPCPSLVRIPLTSPPLVAINNNYWIFVDFPATESEAIPATPGPIDYSIYRTPSGNETRFDFFFKKSLLRDIKHPCLYLYQFPKRSVLFAGQYYCAPCNLSLNSESTFAQHVESKKHKNQSNPKSPSNAVVVSKKARFKKK